MIYEIADKAKLRPLVNKPAARGTSFADTLTGCVLLAILIPLLPALGVVVLMLLAKQQFARNKPPKDEPDEETGRMGFDVSKIEALHEHDPRQACLTIRMNYHALKALATALKSAFSERESGDIVHDKGYSVDMDNCCPWLPCPLEVRSGEGSLKVQHGFGLSARAELWQQICGTWLRVAEERRPRLIVLDEHETDVCDPASTGRFMIEYIPDFVASGKRRRGS